MNMAQILHGIEQCLQNLIKNTIFIYFIDILFRKENIRAQMKTTQSQRNCMDLIKENHQYIIQ